MRKIIVIGGSHHNALGVIRSLGEVGLEDFIYFISISSTRNFVCDSKYLKRRHIYQLYDATQINEVLLSINMKDSEKPVIICCGDEYIKWIDESSEYLSKFFILPNADKMGRIAFFLDKDNQSQLAISCGLIVPPFKLFQKSNIESILTNIHNLLPCIVKPLNSTKGSKSDIIICQTAEHLKHVLDSVTYDVRIEKFIYKKLEFQLIGCSLKNDIIIPGYTTIIRQPENTNTGYLKYSSIKDGTISTNILANVKNFIRQIGYEGLFSVEFIRDSEGHDYFLEINMRNDGNGYCVTAAGINLPYIWAKYAGTNEKVIERVDFDKPIFWMPELQDIRNVKNVGILQWLKEFVTADAHAIFQLRDPKPFLTKLLSRL